MFSRHADSRLAVSAGRDELDLGSDSGPARDSGNRFP
jgi:hypothetical protein